MAKKELEAPIFAAAVAVAVVTTVAVAGAAAVQQRRGRERGGWLQVVRPTN